MVGSPKPILLAIDGEPHTDAAIRRALELAAELGARVIAVHVKDPYLKQFASEIYAQGREEYLDHVDDCLESESRAVVSRFIDDSRTYDVEIEVKVLEGDTVEVLRDEIRGGRYGALVLGGKRRRGLDAWRSRNLPRELGVLSSDVDLVWVPARP